MAKGNKENRLQFVFTEKSFIVDKVDEVVGDKDRDYKEAFLDNKYEALYSLAFEEEKRGCHPSFAFLRMLSHSFIRELTDIPGLEILRENAKVSLSDELNDKIIRMIPFGIGTEYIVRPWIENIFDKLNAIYTREMSEYNGTVKMYLTEKNQELRVPERIFFHLVDYDDDEYPFAFQATYASESKHGIVEHKELLYALTEYKEDKKKLLGLLACLDKASEVSDIIKGFVESGEMFHPLKLTSQEAYELLQSVEAIEECGILCRVPNWWMQKKQKVSVNISIGNNEPSLIGFDALITMVPALSVDGEILSQEEIEYLLEQEEGLSRVKGKWVVVDSKKVRELQELMDKYHGELSLLEALKIQNGIEEVDDSEESQEEIEITNGEWLSDLTNKLRHPSTIGEVEKPESVDATLRGYQEIGYSWLWYMRKLHFGACLADDMGLGKTLQVLTFLERLRQEDEESENLLIVPATLLANWESEAKKFTPDMGINIIYGKTSKELDEEVRKKRSFLNITTYQMASRIEAIQEIEWDCLILDEAQAIKNHTTKQCKAVKKIKAKQKIAMTGTPIENNLENLWSLFDFLNKGLLGTIKEFQKFTSKLDKDPDGYLKLRNMVSPFILRRLKTDKTIIKDLPEKMEQIDYVELTPRQVRLYKRQVKELEKSIAVTATNLKRSGVVLNTILKLKQICNHPDHYLDKKDYFPKDSGKFSMLKEICETIYEKRERVLVFTQYKEIIPYLATYLESIFGCEGLVLHGDIKNKDRQKIVDKFNGEDYVPFMVISLKAGGSGLNLTAANHVIHFDRWWNSSVEDQATDRVYRIGQKKDVMVYKFVCSGTIEEKINALIESKRELAENIVTAEESWVAELSKKSDDEIINTMKLQA